MADSPFQAPADDKTAPPPPNARPRSLTVVAAMAAALGVLGLFGVLFACFGSVVSLATGGAFTAGMPPEQAAAQEALMSASRPFVFVGMALLLAIIPLAVGLLIGGLQTLMDNPGGAGWLGNAFLFGLVVEPVRLLLQVIQLAVLWDETMAVTAAAAAPAAAGAPGMEGVMDGIVIGSVIAGQVVNFAWFLAKFVFYLVGRRVLASEATQDWLIAKT